jgi:hypothetical protein
VRKALTFIWIAVINTIWWNQNNIVFQDGSGEVGVMVDAVIHKAWLWLKAKEKGFSVSYFEFNQEPKACIKML